MDTSWTYHIGVVANDNPWPLCFNFHACQLDSCSTLSVRFRVDHFFIFTLVDSIPQYAQRWVSSRLVCVHKFSR